MIACILIVDDEQEVRDMLSRHYRYSDYEVKTASHGGEAMKILRTFRADIVISAVNAIFRPVHTIKGNSAFFGMMSAKELAHAMETVLDMLRKEQIFVSTPLIEVLLKGLDELKAMFQRMRAGQPELEKDGGLIHQELEKLLPLVAGEEGLNSINEAIRIYEIFTKSVGLDALFREELARHMDTLATLGKWKKEESSCAAPAELPPEPSSSAQENPEQNATAITAKTHKTMRVSEEYIDVFLSHVGEMIVIREMFGNLRIRLVREGVSDLLALEMKQLTEGFSDLSFVLQKSIMAIRKVPVSNLFRKVPRLVRDVAEKNGKEIDVTVEGGETELDKSIIDVLDAPLIHLVRNAADHGIERVDNRLKKGMSRQGKIKVRVEEESDSIVLSIEDDGAGIDYDALRRKAQDLGLLSPGQSMTKDELVDVLFLPGVSSAKEVTDISGRGVGMDVVKRAIA